MFKKSKLTCIKLHLTEAQYRSVKSISDLLSTTPTEFLLLLIDNIDYQELTYKLINSLNYNKTWH